TPLSARLIARDDARGLVLAQSIVATELVPPFANTGMDGYAVRAAVTPGRLRVVGELPAGAAPTTAVGPGEAIRIMTGAPMPAGADSVVMVERTQTEGDDVVVEVAQLGEHVRDRGGDIEAGAVAFASLGPAPAFGLPGNPVSSRVSFEMFARPALRKLAGRDPKIEPVTAIAAAPMTRRADGKLHLDRVRVWVEDGRYYCERSGA